MTQATVGIIGGSGVYDLDGLQNPHWVAIDTPFGPPSDELLLGTLDGVSLAFLPRHGRGHPHTPSTVNYRANLWALNSLGVHTVVSLSAVGSLREDIAPGTLVLVDQFIDRTQGRASSFFGPGLVAHVSMAEPTCGWLRGLLGQAAHDAGDGVVQGGTYLAMEGPQFSTKAESHLYRQWGCSVVGMTNMPEAKLAREAELCYATVAMATDYDCWREGHDAVTVEQVVQVLQGNSTRARALVRALIPYLHQPQKTCGCGQSLNHAIITARPAWDAELAQRLALLLARVSA
ncbi:MAG: S-methyl-5'-thioadenosine phosphorylase [Burkholderiaceae bacterium]